MGVKEFTPEELNKAAAPDNAPPVDQPQGNALQRVFDEGTKATPYSSENGVVGNIFAAGGNLLKGAASLATPLVHPIETVKVLGKTVNNPFDPEGLVGSMVRPFIKQDGEDSGQYAGRAGGEATKLAGSFLAGEAIPKVGEAVSNVRDPLGAYRSPVISPNEAMARSITDVIKPNPSAYRSVSSGLSDTAPYINDFAQSTGNKFKTPLDFSKAAKGAGQEQSSFFQEHLIDPNEHVDTPHGTVGAVYDELGKINDQLRPSYLKKTEGAEMTALDRQKLEARRDELNEALYDTLSYRSGLPRETIQGINQRGAKMQSIGDETDAAQAMRRQGYQGVSPSGLPLPIPALDRAMRMVDYVRGGPEAVAGRKLARIFKQPMDSPEPLPNVQDLSSYRQMADREALAQTKPGIALRDEESENMLNNESTKGNRLKYLLARKLVNTPLPKE